jgi:hypothetical protein
MPDPKGDKLYVNLSASQTRKRLKGFGHGVKKVQSAGKNQAVVIHTATGQHLRELKSLFSDATPATSEKELGVPARNLRNIGGTGAEWLREIGVETKADLERLGPARAYRLIKRNRPETSPNLLWALAAGLADKDWRELSDEEKDRLRREAGENDSLARSRLTAAKLARGENRG